MSGKDHEIVSMEEGRAAKAVRDTSRGSDQAIEKGKESSNVLPENAAENSLSTTVKERLKSLDDALIFEKAGQQEVATKPMIQKVPAMLREKENLKKYFEPRVVSIGPYHHQNSNLDVKEKQKLKLAAVFIKEYLAVDKENLYLKIRMMIEDLRKCYEPEATQCYNDDDLTWMFLVDGCVVLCYICVLADYDYKGDFGWEILEANIDHFEMDLLLLENQLPYQVLDLLISSSKKSGLLRNSIQKFIIESYSFQTVENLNLELLEKPSHLLDLLRIILIQRSPRPNEKCAFIGRILQKSMDSVFMLPEGIVRNIISFLLDILPHKRTYNVVSSHNFEELKTAGVKPRPSDTDSLTDISFHRGTLKLPPIIVDDAAGVMLLNLAAYEMCPDFPNELEVCYYISFFASFIRQAQDVKELRLNRIIYNQLGGDEEVVKLFKEISTGLGTDHKYRYYPLLKDIQKHCDKKYNVWIAQLKNRYFESPWSVIALLGAIVVLGVTILQTVYAALDYNKEGTGRISSRTILPST